MVGATSRGGEAAGDAASSSGGAAVASSGASRGERIPPRPTRPSPGRDEEEVRALATELRELTVETEQFMDDVDAEIHEIETNPLYQRDADAEAQVPMEVGGNAEEFDLSTPRGELPQEL